MKARAAGHSDIGKVRETNEDQFVVDEQAGFFAVAVVTDAGGDLQGLGA